MYLSGSVHRPFPLVLVRNVVGQKLSRLVLGLRPTNGLSLCREVALSKTIKLLGRTITILGLRFSRHRLSSYLAHLLIWTLSAHLIPMPGRLVLNPLTVVLTKAQQPLFGIP